MPHVVPEDVQAELPSVAGHRLNALEVTRPNTSAPFEAWRSPDVAFADWARVEQVSSIGQAEIGARRIDILPTRYGLMFGTLLFLMLLGSGQLRCNPATC